MPFNRRIIAVSLPVLILVLSLMANPIWAKQAPEVPATDPEARAWQTFNASD